MMLLILKCLVVGKIFSLIIYSYGDIIIRFLVYVGITLVVIPSINVDGL